MANDKIQVTLVRNDKTKLERDETSGLILDKALPHYDIKKIDGAADVRLKVLNKPTKAFLVGSSMSHAELEELSPHDYKIIVLDASTQR